MDGTVKKLLHVGCGPQGQARTTPEFSRPYWRETRLDIDASVSPDIVGSILTMPMVADGTMDGVYASHVLEHLYFHEVPNALAECHRVLNDTGVAVLTSPDLQAVAEVVAKGHLTDTVCVAPVGPIAPIDMLYGYRPALQRGAHHMAHRCGFTRPVLGNLLLEAGFLGVAVLRRGHPYYDLWAVATRWKASNDELLALTDLHTPPAHR